MDMELTVRMPVIGSGSQQPLRNWRARRSRPVSTAPSMAPSRSPSRTGTAWTGSPDFDYAWLFSWLHRPRDRGGDAPLRQVPFLLRRQQRTMGIFATRGPRRVNPIGLSLIQLLEVTGQAVVFAGVDLLDGTPVVDLKPYVTRFDRPPGNPRCGWFDELTISDGTTPEQLAGPPQCGTLTAGRPRPGTPPGGIAF